VGKSSSDEYDGARDEAIEENKNRDYVKAVREDNLREKVGRLMRSDNVDVQYIGRGMDMKVTGVSYIDYKRIVGFDMTVDKLHEIEGRLCSDEASGFGNYVMYVWSDVRVREIGLRV